MDVTPNNVDFITRSNLFKIILNVNFRHFMSNYTIIVLWWKHHFFSVAVHMCDIRIE